MDLIVLKACLSGQSAQNIMPADAGIMSHIQMPHCNTSAALKLGLAEQTLAPLSVNISVPQKGNTCLDRAACQRHGEAPPDVGV